jgi:hypothetical protein
VKESVRILPRDVFARIARFDAPRLIDRWELDPCAETTRTRALEAGAPRVRVRDAGAKEPPDVGVRVEARFDEGEHGIAIVTAADARALHAWLERENVAMPPGAEGHLEPYLQRGWKLLVVRLDRSKVGPGPLSPVRFHYDAATVSLPLRAGIASSPGLQDVVVHVLARSRYRAANRPNVTIPTELDLGDVVRGRLSSFYSLLLDDTLAKTPGAAVTELVGMARSCVACAGKPLGESDLLTLGVDVLPSVSSEANLVDPGLIETLGGDADAGARRKYYGLRPFVLTRMHLRYAKDAPVDDLVLEQSPETEPFEARYVIRHPWTSAAECDAALRGVWADPPPGARASEVATELAPPPREASLATYLAPASPPPAPPPPAASKGGCNGCSTAPHGALMVLTALAVKRRRRRPAARR